MSEVQKEKISALPLDSQEKELAVLHETIYILSERLSPVLTPTEPTPTTPSDDSVKASPSVSPVVESLLSNNSSISRATARLRFILDRLEV